MDNIIFGKPAKIFANGEFQWYLVQYNKNPQQFVRKVVKSNDILWNQFVQLPMNQNDGTQMLEHVLIRDHGRLFLGYILHKAVYEHDVLKEQKIIHLFCTRSLYSSHESNEIMDRLHFNHNFWLLVMYSTCFTSSMNGEQYVFGIFHKKDVIVKRDSYSNHLVAYIQEQEYTHKGLVIKSTNDLGDLMLMFDFLKNGLIKIYKGPTKNDIEKNRQKMLDQVKQLGQKMHTDGSLFSFALREMNKKQTKTWHRLIYLQSLVKYYGRQIIGNIKHNQIKF